jgi:hypothetical protein
MRHPLLRHSAQQSVMADAVLHHILLVKHCIKVWCLLLPGVQDPPEIVHFVYDTRAAALRLCLAAVHSATCAASTGCVGC